MREVDGADGDAAAVPGLEPAFELATGAGAEREVDGGAGAAAGAAAGGAAGDAAGVVAGAGADADVEAGVDAGAVADPEVEGLVDAEDSLSSDLDPFFECLLASAAVALSPLHNRAAKIKCSMRPNFRRTNMIKISPICLRANST